jgi:hypothetical protein
MAKFHINPATGDPGECKAEIKCRFGSPEEHYTSPEAARKAFEQKLPLFPVKMTPETPAQLMDRARVMVPGERVRENNYAELPAGTIILQVHNESGDQRYLIKGEDGKTRSLQAKAVGLIVAENLLFTGGSQSHYVGISPFENDFTASQLAAAGRNQSETIDRIARALHEDWSEDILPNEKAIANVAYDDLPYEWQRENRESAESAFARIRQGIANHWGRSELGAIIHRDWMDRNKDRAPAEQLLPFRDLPDSEKRKDYVVLEAAAEVISTYPKEPSVG